MLVIMHSPRQITNGRLVSIQPILVRACCHGVFRVISISPVVHVLQVHEEDQLLDVRRLRHRDRLVGQLLLPVHDADPAIAVFLQPALPATRSAGLAGSTLYNGKKESESAHGI